MKITVSEVVVRFMERLGIECIFGMPGAHILPVYDDLYDSTISSILVKHEQGAAFMAGGYARLSGRIGACITTAGPGATNLVTGIANAYADKQPILIITGETSTHIFGKGGLQESSGEGGAIDQDVLFKSITRYNKVVERSDYLAQVLNRAAATLLSDNPGPVLLSFPYNVQSEQVDASILDSIQTNRRRLALAADSVQVAELARQLLSARRPVILAGYGCLRAGAGALLQQLSQRLQIPVATSLKGKGVVDERSPLALGSLGVTSNGAAYRYILEQADLLLFLGASFNERTSYLWEEPLLQGKRLIQVDHDEQQLEKVFKADLAIHGDLQEVLTALLDHLQPLPLGARPAPSLNSDTLSDYAIFRSGFALPQRFFERLAERFPDDAVVFDDNIIFAQNFYPLTGASRYFPNSGISSLGHAIPAAIGAACYRPGPLFAVLGDGGFQMCCMELMTAVNYRLPLNVVLFNNGTMGLIRKNQHQHYRQRFIDCDFINPDFALLAESFGISHYRASSLQEIDRIFEQADLRSSINLIEILIDKDNFPNYSSRR